MARDSEMGLDLLLDVSGCCGLYVSSGRVGRVAWAV